MADHDDNIVVTENESTPVVEPESPVESEEVSAESETEPTDEGEEAAESEESEGESESEPEDSTEEEQPRKKKSGFQRRVEKLNARIRERDEVLELYKKELEELKALVKDKPEEKPIVKVDSNEPKEDDYDTYESYINARVQYEARRIIQQEKESERKLSAKQEQQKVYESHWERVQAFADKTPDYNEVFADAGDVQLSVALESEIVNSENGPELLYNLAKDPERLEKLSRMAPVAMARELGRLEAELLKPKTETKVVKTKAPPPPRPISASGTGGVKRKLAEARTQAEFEAIRNEQLKARY